MGERGVQGPPGENGNHGRPGRDGLTGPPGEYQSLLCNSYSLFLYFL